MSDIPWTAVILGGLALLFLSQRSSSDGGNGGENGNGDGNGGPGGNVVDTGTAWVYDGGRTPRVEVSFFVDQDLQDQRTDLDFARVCAFQMARMAETSDRACRMYYDTPSVLLPGGIDHHSGRDALDWFDGYVRDQPNQHTSKDSNMLVSNEGGAGYAWVGGNAGVAGADSLAWADDPYTYKEFRRSVNTSLDPDSQDYWMRGFRTVAHEALHNLGMVHDDPNGCVWQQRDGYEYPHVTAMCNIEMGATNSCGDAFDPDSYVNFWTIFSECTQQHWDIKPEGTSTAGVDRGTGRVVACNDV